MRFENFSYLPPLTPDKIKKLVENMLSNGEVPILEYADPGTFDETYWNLWPLPKEENLTSGAVMEQIESCANTNPFHFVRLGAYDKKRQLTTNSFIVRTPAE